jgi:hypothetical protein
MFVYAETEMQKQNGKLWARSVFVAITGGHLAYNMQLQNLIIDVRLKEPLFISPDTNVVATCPRNIQVLAALYGLYACGLSLCCAILLCNKTLLLCLALTWACWASWNLWLNIVLSCILHLVGLCRVV